MDIKAILEYQSVDNELRKLETELEKSEFTANIKDAQAIFKQAKETVSVCDKEAEQLLTYYNKALTFYNDSLKKIEEISSKVKADNGEGMDIDKLKGQLSALNDRFSKIDKDLGNIQKRIEEITTSYASANKKGAQAKKDFYKNREQFDVLKKSKEPQINELRRKLKSLEGNVDPQILEKYNSLKKDRVYSAFVKLEQPNKCGGCRMDIALDKLNTLKEKGVVACESCRRIVYIEK